MPATLAQLTVPGCRFSDNMRPTADCELSTANSLRDRLVRHGCEQYHSEQRRITIQRHLQASRRLAALLDGASSENEIDARALVEIAREYLPLLLRDRDSVLTCPFSPVDELQQANRRLEVALLAMAVGIELDFSEPQVELLGIAGLLHDCRHAVRRAPSLPPEVIAILRAAAAIRRRIVPHSSPKRKRGPHAELPRLHFGLPSSAAEILYVVETYVRLRSPRAGRPAASPARALRRIVRGNGRAIDGSVPRAMLRVLSLFPIGSRVQLSDGSLARVVRANADDFTCPVVQLLSDADETQHAPLLDLAYSDLRIVRSLSD